jgi:hypothetical protein
VAADMNGKQFSYRVSKTGLNVLTRVFADELKGRTPSLFCGFKLLSLFLSLRLMA